MSGRNLSVVERKLLAALVDEYGAVAICAAAAEIEQDRADAYAWLTANAERQAAKRAVRHEGNVVHLPRAR